MGLLRSRRSKPGRVPAGLACCRGRTIPSLLGEAIADQRCDWELECVEVDVAFSRWSTSTCDRDEAYVEYLDALDREQRACEVYRDLLAAAARNASV